jgi:hypothetical protein
LIDVIETTKAGNKSKDARRQAVGLQFGAHGSHTGAKYFGHSFAREDQ